MKKDYILSLSGGTINAKKGDEIDLPRWQALYLKSIDVADIKEEEVDINYLNSYHFKEKRNQAPNQLSPLPQDFYIKISSFIKSLDKAISQNPTHMLINDREAAEKNFIELSESRLLKLIRLSQTNGDDLRDRMTPEEFLIYSTIKNIIFSWRSYILNLSKGGVNNEQ
ncbi:GINS complex subunit Sld5 [Caldisphaera lagunensis DSM 15908]|uniref:GINS complex subunit Sld5 n=2 Tax=Caldisphaera lagunensis TaxID=200415 RepID=L0AAF9_CALLD|nr:GINS complex subunit Sld5 [Caldisphaera lagunensis DSM 15908]